VGGRRRELGEWKCAWTQLAIFCYKSSLPSLLLLFLTSCHSPLVILIPCSLSPLGPPRALPSRPTPTSIALLVVELQPSFSSTPSLASTTPRRPLRDGLGADVVELERWTRRAGGGEGVGELGEGILADEGRVVEVVGGREGGRAAQRMSQRCRETFLPAFLRTQVRLETYTSPSHLNTVD
jgi:hypothetical protein